MVFWSTKSGNISETRKAREKVTMGPRCLGKRTNALSNGTIADPLRPPLPQDWGFAPHPKLQSLLSQERVKLRTFKLARTITTR